MEQLFTWVKDVFLIIISLTFFQILIPDSNMAKYCLLYTSDAADE